jgi:pimeloyl-ACP methyl ester carboxylesterase
MTKSDHALPTLFFIHCLGGSARSWSRVIERLPEYECVPIDLPGFGGTGMGDADAVSALADHVAAVVKARAPGRWAVIGHSMGAKLASILARRAESGEPGLEHLSHLVLLAGSPPRPEPMDETVRETMLGWFRGDEDQSRNEARAFVSDNVGIGLDAETHAAAVDEVLRSDPNAWRAWLDTGSREDWEAMVDTLRTPCLIVAGGADGPLGPEAQRRTASRHAPHARLVTLSDAGHLLPLEEPDDVARLIGAFAADGIPPRYRRLLETDRVSARTRDVLVARANAGPAGADTLPAASIATLHALLDRVVPQSGAARIDLVNPILTALAGHDGDGWRFDALPDDRTAYGTALEQIDATARQTHGARFADLDAAQQDALIGHMAEGALDGERGFTGAQMRVWFEELRADATRAYVAHPATLARIGYSGIANGGDTARKSGFTRVGLSEHEPWEPRSETIR